MGYHLRNNYVSGVSSSPFEMIASPAIISFFNYSLEVLAMGMSFPNMKSLTHRASQRGFRQPHEDESEDDYRVAFADYMRGVDIVESAEIRTKLPQELLSQDPRAALTAMMGEEALNNLMASLHKPE